ncbi:tryptophan aminotransferase-related protein 1-like [Zingiber officinale]|uniref:Alliinase C-terminal domain-containing protein n=1 Tax=Zingiber officinale TaxID=94328 RepID=A0A8J5K7A7_ZINOF|nr:tryptophan aminotransferase-related protein 1-like [Zingiber officinale]KAG6476639.1 hypothetical protein ZIOFF_065884 [Zingiber officinale]
MSLKGDVSTLSSQRPTSKDAIVNLDRGDPTMYEAFWKSAGADADTFIPGWTSMSYFSDATKLCFYLNAQLTHQIRRLHNLVGNAIAGDDRFIIVGTGSSQLFQASLYALSPPDAAEPMSVVSLAPYYSTYAPMTDLLQSRLHKWAGDASKFAGDRYIEIVCTPNNPDGSIREAVLCSGDGKTIHDLAYYWPQYTAITHAADHDIMLFTLSKITGHAGSRIGWAVVKDREVAKRMMHYITLNSIGVAKEAQLRAEKILQVVSDGYENTPNPDVEMKLFHFGREKLAVRWRKLVEAVQASGIFTVPSFEPAFCNFIGEVTENLPAFAWIKCEKNEVEDLERYLKEKGVIVRGGIQFGMEARYARISMLDRDSTFDLFLERLSAMS